MRVVVDMDKKYVMYNKLSKNTVAGPRLASWTIEFCCVKPTTVVSTRLNKGSDNQIKMVVPQKMSNLLYEGDVSAALFCSSTWSISADFDV